MSAAAEHLDDAERFALRAEQYDPTDPAAAVNIALGQLHATIALAQVGMVNRARDDLTEAVLEAHFPLPETDQQDGPGVCTDCGGAWATHKPHARRLGTSPPFRK